MRNLRTWMFFVISVIFFGSISVYMPLYQGSTKFFSLALSVTSTLFGLLIGFFITQMWNKFSSIRKESAELRSYLLSMISNMRMIEGNENVKEEFEDRMERFLIAFVMVAWDSVEEEDRYFARVTESISDFELLNERDSQVFKQLMESASAAGKSRSKLASLGKDGLMKMEWTVLLTLSGVMTISVIMLRDGSLFFTVLATVLPSIVALTMMILDDLDNLRWGVTVVSFEPAQAALEELNRKKFYESRFVDNGWVEEPEVFRTEEDLGGDLKEVYEELKLKDCLREKGVLGPKL